MQTRFYLIMGVSGSGKSSVGGALAQHLGWDFFDADDYHPAENIAKMSKGIPLTDEDRLPWLNALHMRIYSHLNEESCGVLACSALKEEYRQILLADCPDVQIVYLKGSYDLIWSRMSRRTEHYMAPAMLQSQFDILEVPSNALVVEIDQPLDKMVNQIINTEPKGLTSG